MALDWDCKNRKKQNLLKKKIQSRKVHSDASCCSDDDIPENDDWLPRYSDVLKAQKTMKGFSHRTKVMTSKTINKALGQGLNNGKGGNIEVFFKCEQFQKCGSFKFRGAFNALSNLTPE
jgi:hypothetical protein